MDGRYDPEVYKNARSPRPGWANALIVALVAFLAGVAGLLYGAIEKNKMMMCHPVRPANTATPRLVNL